MAAACRARCATCAIPENAPNNKTPLTVKMLLSIITYSGKRFLGFVPKTYTSCFSRITRMLQGKNNEHGKLHRQNAERLSP